MFFFGTPQVSFSTLYLTKKKKKRQMYDKVHKPNVAVAITSVYMLCII